MERSKEEMLNKIAKKLGYGDLISHAKLYEERGAINTFGYNTIDPFVILINLNYEGRVTEIILNTNYYGKTIKPTKQLLQVNKEAKRGSISLPFVFGFLSAF